MSEQVEVKKIDAAKFWEEWEEIANAEEPQLGGGFIGLIAIETGYKLFISGVSNKESWFSSGKDTEQERADAREKAKAFLAENGHGDVKLNYGINIICPVETCYKKGEQVEWASDRHFFIQKFTDAWKKVVRPAFIEHSVITPSQIYAKVSFADDPYYVAMGDAGKKKTDQNGNPKYPDVAYISVVYTPDEFDAELKRQQEANQTVEPVNNDGAPPVPQGWVEYPNEWPKELAKQNIEKKKLPNGKTVYSGIETAVTELGATEEEIIAWVEYLVAR